MAMPLSNEIRQLLDGPNFAHLATLMPDGSPQSVPVWVGRDGDRVIICTPDKDLGQCVSGSRVVQLNRRTRTIFDETAIAEKFGVTLEREVNMI